MNAKRIIALAGLSGAGKTTLIRQVVDESKVVHLSTSELIKTQIKVENVVDKTSEALRTGNIANNQDRLITAFTAIAPSITEHIILGCHTIIDTPTGIQEIPIEVFKTIKITDFLFLSVDPMELYQRREKDMLRSRPIRTIEELESQQKIGLELAHQIAEALCILFFDIGAAPEEQLLSILQSLPLLSKRTPR